MGTLPPVGHKNSQESTRYDHKEHLENKEHQADSFLPSNHENRISSMWASRQYFEMRSILPTPSPCQPPHVGETLVHAAIPKMSQNRAFSPEQRTMNPKSMSLTVLSIKQLRAPPTAYFQHPYQVKFICRKFNTQVHCVKSAMRYTQSRFNV